MRTKTVILFGGSFNPPHIGHFETAKHLQDILHADETWFLFSMNWQKNPANYAPLADRIRMGRIMAGHYPDYPFIMSTIEEEIGSHITYDVLKALKQKFPDTHFIWAMSTDNLASFHTWEHYDDILKEFPVAILHRPPYDEAALQSPTASTFADLRIDDPQDLLTRKNGWCILKNKGIELSSTSILQNLRAGQTRFDGPVQEIADYIRKHGLYGLTPAKIAPPKPKFA